MSRDVGRFLRSLPTVGYAVVHLLDIHLTHWANSQRWLLALWLGCVSNVILFLFHALYVLCLGQGTDRLKREASDVFSAGAPLPHRSMPPRHSNN